MSAPVFFGVAGVVLLVWGLVVARWNHWAHRLQGRTLTGQQFSPGFIRLLGVGLAIGGALFVVLAVAGAFSDHPA
ncbi:hypothetical protein GCM10011512_10300 [Tersicoccus solisilvae]|uniref:Uncharacterized protein n=1 Tax=Tersicoccus solisilvae TaxID=1882339 RepID=A0ABQ1NUE8_9MICC|nr:hypothetical protein [Tersicoccus solisilvae]GGC85373.1 hypothetical protein GCM10011512_10300 [Tersicoccus solisilvae]